MNGVSSKELLRSLVMFNTVPGSRWDEKGWHTNEFPQRLVPWTSGTIPACSLCFVAEKNEKEEEEEEEEEEKGRLLNAPAWSVNIETPYASPCGPYGPPTTS